MVKKSSACSQQTEERGQVDSSAATLTAEVTDVTRTS